MPRLLADANTKNRFDSAACSKRLRALLVIANRPALQAAAAGKAKSLISKHSAVLARALQ